MRGRKKEGFWMEFTTYQEERMRAFKRRFKFGGNLGISFLGREVGSAGFLSQRLVKMEVVGLETFEGAMC
jgi:hypothetical protein